MPYPGYNLNGFTVFILFTLLFGFAQAAHTVSAPLSWAFLLPAGLLYSFLLVKGSNDDLFVFLFFSSLVRIIIPQNFRELSLFLPLLTGTVILIKRVWCLNRIPKYSINSVLLLLILFFVFVSFQVFQGMQLPGFARSGSGNTGFLGRWSQLNNILLFVVLFASFKPSNLHYILSKMRQFYACVISICFLMLLFHVNSIPLFNSFTWSVVVESATARKMIIAGTAAVILLTYEITGNKLRYKNLIWILCLLIVVFMSGSRTAFLSFFLTLFFGFAIHKGYLLRSIGLMILSAGLGITLLLSPLILYIPAKFQRLVIIFPSEFYTGKLYELRASSAANSSNFRYDMWQKATESIRKHPLTGKGIGIPKANYDLKAEGLSAFNKIDAKILIEDFMAAGSLHNAIVSIAYIFGLPAAVFFLLFLIALLLRTYKMSQLADEANKPLFIFLTLLVLNFIFQAFISDIHNSQEFYALAAVALKYVLAYEYKISSGTLSTASA